MVNHFKLTPKFKPVEANKFKYYCKLKLEKNAGLIWDTQNDDNPFHCTFFKCDGFTADKLNVLEIRPIEP